jgi:hypothetical protein
MQRHNSNKEILKRGNSKMKDQPKIQQSPVITTSKVPSKPTNNPYSSKNTFEILNKINDNYPKPKSGKNPIELRPSTPQNRKTPSTKPKKITEMPKKVVYTREKAALLIQRTFRRHIKVIIL